MTVQSIDPFKHIEQSNPIRRRLQKKIDKSCNVKTLKRRLPILQWLPNYSLILFLQDVMAGITVGLTAIPQGLAYAVIAGVPPEYGLYSSIADGFVYVIFGSSKDLAVGPTAIIATMVAKYASQSTDFAVLASFLTGVTMLAMGIFNLGFLVNFISTPVIHGFTTAAAMQIGASQLKAFFGLQGKSGNFFAESIKNFIANIKTTTLWDPILGMATLFMLIGLKLFGNNCNRTDGWSKKIRWFVSMSRNTVVVFFGMILAYIVKVATNREPIKLIGDIGGGFPVVEPPPFSTTNGNETLSFVDMLNVLGPQSIVLPIVAILEVVAITKAFAKGGQVDATQEMFAVGLCNIAASFFNSMPITGSFSRSAINYASGVQTPVGGLIKSLLIIASLSLITSSFYYIPNASLAALIIVAMHSMIHVEVFGRFWRNCKVEFVIANTTMLCSLFYGLEFGIVCGILLQCIVLLYFTSKPRVTERLAKGENGEIPVIVLSDSLYYSSAEYIRKAIVKASDRYGPNDPIYIDGRNVQILESTVAANIIHLIKDFDKTSRIVVLMDFRTDFVNLFVDIYPEVAGKFVNTHKSIDKLDIITKTV